MRLFVAIEIPDEVRRNLTQLVREFRTASPETKWVRPENLHVTLKFLGASDMEKSEQVKSALSSIHSTQSVKLEFRGIGFFPNSKRPRVLWIGIASSSNLSTLAAEMDSSLHKLGFPLEDRKFTPHLTLARFDHALLSPALRAAIAENASRQFGTFSTGQFHLIESKLKSTGAEYTTLQSFSFLSEA